MTGSKAPLHLSDFSLDAHVKQAICKGSFYLNAKKKKKKPPKHLKPSINSNAGH
jgi:hypothetical protein